MVYVLDDSNDSHKKQYSDQIANAIQSSDFKTKRANYSWNDLNDTMDKLNEYKKNNPNSPISKNFNSFMVLDGENKIVVELDDYDEDSITQFKDSLDESSMIEFVPATNHFINEINPGDKVNFGSYYGSMGYRATRNGVNGIVTAAHFTGQTVGSNMSVNGVNVGTVRARQMSGSVDASFVEITNSSYLGTNTVSGYTLSTTISEPGVGTVINKVGISTGSTSGKVISTNASTTDSEGITYTNLTTADYESDGGDSGGLVYSYISSTNTRLTLGIHKGASGSTRYFVRANEINKALGTSRY